MNELTLSECSNRKLDETYLVVYAIKNEINIKKGDYIEKSTEICELLFYTFSILLFSTLQHIP